MFALPRFFAPPAAKQAPPAPAPPAVAAPVGPQANNIVVMKKKATPSTAPTPTTTTAHTSLRARLRRMAAEDTGGWAASGLAEHFASANPAGGDEHGDHH